MNDQELRNRIQNRLQSATIKIDAARSAAYREQYNSAAEWLEQAAEKIKEARSFMSRIGEDPEKSWWRKLRSHPDVTLAFLAQI